MMWKIVLIVPLFLNITVGNEIITINSDDFNDLKLKPFWRSTGFCPPHGNVTENLESEDVKINLAYIGAIPNKGIEYIRIHWLLEMITVKKENGKINFDFSKLDELIDWLHKQRLLPIFEIMGNPSNYFKFDGDTANLEWVELVYQLLLRYIDKYEKDYVKKWKFETWNEPNTKTFNTMNFDFQKYAIYLLSTSEALNKTNLKNYYTFGGPACTLKKMIDFICTEVMFIFFEREIDSDTVNTFWSIHIKGAEVPSNIINESIKILDKMTKWPNKMSFANTEADIMEGWSKSREWRGDVRYPAMIINVIVDYYQEIIQKRKINIEVISNDNAFLNQHPYYFTQRTLLARFQDKNSNPPHFQFFRKPVYYAMALLSFLGDNSWPDKWSKKRTSTGTTYPYKYVEMETDSLVNGVREYCWIAAMHNDTFADNSTDKYGFRFGLNIDMRDGRYVAYMLNNIYNNPYEVWKKAGSPVFPDRGIREKMRTAEGVYPLARPTPMPAKNTPLYVDIKPLTIPTIVLVHICEKSLHGPGPVTGLQIFQVCNDEVLVLWSDEKVQTKCIKTYEVMFRKAVNNSEEQGDQLFERINKDDSIFLTYQYVATGLMASRDDSEDLTRGQYRVRAVDYWDRPGPFSDIISHPA